MRKQNKVKFNVHEEFLIIVQLYIDTKISWYAFQNRKRESITTFYVEGRSWIKIFAYLTIEESTCFINNANNRRIFV